MSFSWTAPRVDIRYRTGIETSTTYVKNIRTQLPVSGNSQNQKGGNTQERTTAQSKPKPNLRLDLLKCLATNADAQPRIMLMLKITCQSEPTLKAPILR
jgi:hypothetical protein